ncbi:MAG: thiamine-monophosphate kinase [Myxococcota bacterium]|jgi:thiamine-monophosphate kinase
MTETIGDLGEDWVISTVRDICRAPAGPRGPGDDAAVLPVETGRTRVITVDALIEGVHFLPRHPPEALGWKALAVNLSDLAAMGAAPSEWLLTAALPPSLPGAFWRSVAIGMAACADHYGAVLVGGDTVRAPGPMMLSITAIGTLAAGTIPITRNGGRGGDILMALGRIGRSGLGLRRWLADSAVNLEDACVMAHLRPTPDVAAGLFAAQHGATAGMDLSDGLATDLPRLADASGLTLEVDLDGLPVDPACVSLTALERAASGEDYGLALLVPPAQKSVFESRGFTVLGRALERSDASTSVVWRSGGAAIPAPQPSFAHFP